MSSVDSASEKPKRGLTFWMIFIALIASFFLVLLEGNVVATALPTIASDLHATEFIWVATAYAVAATALLPLSGGLAQVFGRRPLMIASLVIFSVGAALCGASRSMNMLVASRVVLGVGGGGIMSLTSIIVADMVPLHERGLFNGLLGLTWSIAQGIGPVVGGSLAQDGQWRWLFYLNLPIAGVSLLLVLKFLKLPTPPGTVREKLAQIDWIGNFIVVGSTTAVVLGLTWGGVTFPWTSPQVLAPLIVGGIGLLVFAVYEAKWCKYPLVPPHLLNNLSSISGFAQTFMLSIPLLSLMYYLPVYYQACHSATPTTSGIDIFGISFTVAPFSIIAGTSITLTKRYRPQIWTGWCLVLVGLGLMSTISADTSQARSIGYQTVVGVGIGLVYSSTYFPVLAPLPVKSNAHALALYVFFRSFAQIWGVAIGATVLQNGLTQHLPADFTSLFPQGTEIAYATIPQIPNLPEPLRDQVRVAFADSLATLWRVMIAIAGVGFLSSLLMKALPLHTYVDADWQVKEDRRQSSSAEAKEEGVSEVPPVTGLP